MFMNGAVWPDAGPRNFCCSLLACKARDVREVLA